ncbi:hypothetical protein ABZU32_35610 [Sphaerisporangium sp. NPDC005288]|uniref:hypothetical protein n=1 Tax=Sphaerisporangium sp. NPDC005288 TaxID=3155114 RepID=UPI0033AEDF56
MQIRSQVLRLMATPHADSRFHAAYLPQSIAAATGCRPHEAWEALWGLLADGLIYLDPERQPASDNWRWKLSERGRRAVEGGPWEPYDPEGYLRRLRRQVPDLHPIAYQYMQEALQSFNAGCYLACSVMLGVAAEQVFIRVAEAMVAALGDSAEKLRKELDNPKSSQNARFQALRARLEPLRNTLPDDLGDNLTMDAVADLLRVTRNEAGHPRGRAVDEDTAYTHLQLAARYLGKMTALAEHFTRQVAARSTAAGT